MSDSSLNADRQDDNVGLHTSSVGRQLQLAREAKGLSLADVAESLKLGKRQVEALEGDNWSQLPGNTFIRGFVRNYARLVNLEPTHLMDELDQKLDIAKPPLSLPESTHAEMPRPSGQAQRRDYLLAIIGLSLVLLAALIYFFLPNDIGTLRSGFSSLLGSISATTPASTTAPNGDLAVLPPGQTLNQVLTPQAAESSPESTPSLASSPQEVIPAKPASESPTDSSTTSAQPTTTTTASTAPLRLSFLQECWVEVRDRQGNVIFSQNGNAGMDRDIEGQRPFSLTIGNIKGVKVIHRGQLVDLAPYARGEVARLTLE